jgi:hypothetical protein
MGSRENRHFRKRPAAAMPTKRSCSRAFAGQAFEVLEAIGNPRACRLHGNPRRARPQRLKQLEANFQTILGPEGAGGSHAMRNRTPSNAAVSVATYRNDPLYPRIVRAVAAILEKGKTVTAVDVLIGMGLLTPEHLEAWRRGRIPYLEQVIDCNLTRLLTAVTDTPVSRSRSKAGPLRNRLRVLQEGTAAVALHQNRRCQARTGICKAFYLARKGPVPFVCNEAPY